MTGSRDQNRHRPPRVVHFITEAVWAGAFGIWRPINTLAGVGLVGAAIAGIGAGVAIARVLGTSWLLAWIFLIVLLVALVGGYRVWSEADVVATEAKQQIGLLQQQAARQAVTREHQEHIVQQIRGFQGPVANDNPCFFGDPADGRPLHHEAFTAHLPALTMDVDRWNETVWNRRAAPDLVRARIAREAEHRGIVEDIYDVGAVVLKVTDALTEIALAGKLEGPVRLQTQVFETSVGADPQIFFRGAEAFATIPLGPQERMEQARRNVEGRVEDLLNDARDWDETRGIRSSQDGLDSLRRPLLDELQRHTSTNLIVSAACPFCDAQAAQLARTRV